MKAIPTLRPDPAPTPAWTGYRLVLCALAAVAAAALLLHGQDGRDHAVPTASFLQQALGQRDAGAELVREPLRGVRTVLDGGSFRFERAGESVGLAATGVRGDWTRYAAGAVRATPFGSETLVFRGEDGLEEFLTVDRRQGKRTWSWQLDADDLEPRSRVDGSVEFHRRGGTASLRIAPVAILDAQGGDVTPEGLRWSLARRDSSWWLELELDDAGLPLPYVIDPAIGPAATATASATGSPLVLTRPGSAGDLLVAQIAVRDTGAITAPAGWTLIGTATGTAIKQSAYWRFATGSEAAADLTWSWPAGHGAGSIVAYANAHPSSPVDASNQGYGSGTTASAPTVTTTFPNDRLVAFYGVATGASTVTPTAGQGQTELFVPTGTTSGGPAGSRITIGATEATQATPAAVAAKTAAVSNVAWVGNLIAIRQAPDDGAGTLTTATSALSAASSGNTITFTYTAGAHGVANGAVAVDVPAGWSPPSTTGSAAGYTTSSTGTVGVSGQQLTVTGVTLNAGATLTITYGSKASGGPGATASSATGAVSFGALARGTAAGTLTALGASPSITQYAPDGSGTLGVSPTQIVAGNAVTLTFTYTAATGGMSNGDVTIAVPAGWTAPNTTAGTPGYTTASTGTVNWNGGTRTLTVSGVTRAAGTTLTITYGAGAGGAVTVPAGSGSVAWQAQQRSLAGGTLAALAASPSTTYNAPPTATVTLTPAGPTTNQVLTATATKDDADGNPVTLTYVWKVDGVTRKTTSGSASLTDTFDLAGASDGDKGQTVSVEVTPNDGSQDGSTVSDAEVVANSAPTISSVSIDQGSPRTNDTLTVSVTSADADGDARTYAYQWRKNGVDIAGATAATLDLSAAGHGSKGDAISVEVTASDGGASSAPSTSAAVTVANSAPTVSSVTIDQGAPTTNETLTVTVASADADGDARSYAYQWRKGGVDLTGETGATLDLSTAGNGNKGDQITVEVVANDGTVDSAPAGSAAVTVANAAPTVTSVTIDQLSPKTNDTLTVSVTSADADGDARSYAYQWRKGGVDLTGETAATLDLSAAGNGGKGDQITVEVTANDGSDDSAPSTSTPVTIQNSLPVATIALAPDPAGTNDTLTATATRGDADGDTVTLTYVWKVNGATVRTTAGSASLSDTLDAAQAGNGDAGETVTVEVTPNDGAADGTFASDAVGIGNSLPTATVSLAPSSPTTSAVLTATATKADTDGDPVTLTYVWKVDGATVKTTAGSSSLTDTLDLGQAGNGDKGETVSVEVTPNDGSADGSAASDSEVVGNTAPTATVSLAPAPPATDDVVTATATRGDADGDTVTLTYVWKVDGATVKTTAGSSSLTDTLDLGQAGNGDKGETVSVEVTPNDGAADGTAATDSEVVANSAPVLSAVSIAEAAPRTNDTLSLSVTATDADGDTLTPTRQWRRNGVDLGGETAATLDLAVAGNGDKGDQLDVRLFVSDGTTSSGTLTSAAVTVQNTAPTVVSAMIDQASPRTNDALTVTVVTADADGDARTETFQWAKNGVDRFGETAAGYDLASIGNGDKGEDVTVRVVASDGSDPSAPVTSAAVTVANSTPVVDTVSVDQGGPRTNDTLTLSVTSHDDDGDAVAHAYQWRKNAADLAGATTATLDLSQAGNGEKGDQIAVRVTGSDGGPPSAPLTSSAVTVANTAPTATVSLAPASPTTQQVLTATATRADVDGDTVTLTYVWKVDGATVRTTAGTSSLSDALDLGLAGNGDEDEVVTVEVVPHDGDESGAPTTDSETVANSAPAISSVTIDQASPRTNDVLSATAVSTDADGDARTYGYQWQRNGADVAGETGATLDLSAAGNGDKGDEITVRVVASDGDANSAPSTSAAVTVANSAPTIASVSIDQAAPQTNDALGATVVSADADGDARSYAYQWQRNGVDLPGETAATLDLSAAGNGSKGDDISVEVTATDGGASSAPSTSAPVTIRNSAPTITLAAIDQASAQTNDTIDSTVTAVDADGDTVTVTRRWTKNAVDLAGETGTSLDLSGTGNGDQGDVLRVRGEATDGDDDAAPVTSAPLTISNSAPTAGVSLSPAAPATDDVVTATATRGDADGDTVTLTYVWKVDGVTVKTTAGSSSTTDTLDLALAGNGDGGETVSVDVTPHDGTTAGSPQSDSVVVDFVPDHLTFTSSTADLASGAQRTLSVEVRDPDGAPVTDDNATVVTFAKAGGTGTVAGLGTATAAGGVASLDVDGALAGAVTITATAAGLTADSAGLTVVHGTATQLDLDVSGSNASGATTTLTATILDAAGNTVTSDGSTVVGFAKTGGAGTATGLGADTAAAGVASLDVTNAAAGQIDVEATAAGLASGSASWTIDPGSASTATSTIDASPATIVANGTSTSTITVRLKDAAGNDLTATGGLVTLALAGTGSLGSVTDEGDGTYTATLTSPTAVGSGSITGTLNAVALADGAAVTYAHGPAAALVLTDSGSTVAGDAHTLTATVVDAHGNTVASDGSTVVGFAKAGGAGTVTGLGTATASSGVATKAIANALAGPISLEASAGGLTPGTTGYTIVPGPVSAATSTVTAAPASVQNNGTDASTVTVTVRDAGGNPLAGATVTLDDAGADSAIAPASTTTNGAGVATFGVTSTTVETAVYAATADGVELADTASVSFVFNDTTGPTSTVTLAAATGAFLSGTDLFYRPAAAGSFTLSSAVADTGSGPESATYPAVAEPGWTHALETVATPAAGPYVSSPFAWTAAAGGDFSIAVTAADAWTPPNTTDTTIDVIEDSSAPTGQTIALGGGPVHAALSVPFVLGDGSDLGAGVDPATRTVTRESALLTDGSCGAFTSDVGLFTSPDTTVQSGRCYRYTFTLADRVGNVSAGVTSAAAQVDTVAPGAPAQTVTETGDDGHAVGSILYYDPAGSGTFTVTAAASDAESGIDKVGFAAPAAGFSSADAADDSTSPYTRSYSWSAGATGSGPQAVTAFDRAGHSTAGSFTLTPDAADPAVSFDAPAAAAMLDSSSHALEATASDAGAGVASVLFEVSTTGAGGPFSAIGTADTTAPYAVAWDTSTEADGPKVLRATVTDNVGRTAQVTRNVAVDKVPGPPATSIASRPADPSANTTPSFGFGSSETPSSFECRVDGGSFGACPTPHTVLPALGDGSHTLEVRASDAAGNQDATPESYTWVVDATAPTGSLTAPAALAAVSGSAVVVTADSADAGSGVQHALFEVLAGGSWQALGAPDETAPYSVGWDTTGLADGDHDLRVTTRDNAGNSAVSAVRTVTVDNSLPLLSASVSHNPVNLTTPDPAQVTAVADDLGSGIANVLFEQCNETSAACTSDTWTTLVGPDTVAPYEVDWALPSDGPRLLRVTATDNAGRSAVELILTSVDRTRPTGSVTAPAAGADLRGSVPLAATASDPAPGSVNTVTFQLSAAGAGVWADLGTDGSAPYGATLDTTALADGLYDLRVFTTDAAGNAETTPATTSVRVDNTAPATTDDAPAGWRNGDVAVSLAAADAGGSGVAQTEFRLDGGAAQPSTGTVTVSGEGVHALDYRSQDVAGNWEDWRTATVRIDETDPVTADDAPVAWQAGATTVELSPTDAGGSGLATTTYELDGGATQAGTTVAVPATHGVHTITYRSTDAAGNVEADRTATVRVDRQAPTTTDDAPAGLGSVPVTVTLSAGDPDSGVATTTYEVDGGATQTGTSVAIPAVTGSYTITYRSTDAVGNVEATRTATVQIDATAPTTSATISPRDPNNGPITVSLSAVDAGGAGVDETRFRIDGGAETVGSSALVAGADGPHTVRFYSVDTLGNVEAEQLVTVTIDTAGPTGTPANPGGYLRGSAAELRWTPDTPADVTSVTFEFSTAGAGAWAALPGGTIATPMLADYTYSWNTTAVADGDYDLRVRVEDPLGNETIQLLPGLPKTVDNGAPTASVSTPAGGSFVSGSVALGGSAADALSGISSTAVQLKPAGAAGFTTVASSASGLVSSTWDSTSVADGPVELKVVATDGAGNQAESAVVTFTVDNDAPTVTLGDPGAAVTGSPALTATAAVDTVSVDFEYRAAGSTPWLAIGSDATPGDGFSGTWSTGSLADGAYELRARATDGGGNTGTSGIRSVLVDKTSPTGSVSAPASGSTIGGAAVALAAAAADTGAGVRDVVFQVKQLGSATFDSVGTDASDPYAVTWDASGATDGAAELRVVVTDVVGNTRTSAVVPVTIDSSGPSVTLADPGSALSGTVPLSVTTGGAAVRVRFEVSPAGAGSWTEIGTDTAAPFGAALDTAALADGVYDLRATGFDALDNPSAPSVRAGVRFDNTAPSLVSAAPADGSVSAAASQIVLEASEPVTVVAGALLDGGAAPAPAISGTTITFATGALPDGLHVLSGRLEDASGTQTPFRVAVTVESAPGADRPPVEKSMSASSTTTLTAAGALATVSLAPAAWPASPSAEDFLVVRVDPAPPAPSVAPGLVPGGQLLEVTARWALTGAAVTEFAAPLEITIPNAGGGFAIPATSDDGTSWRSLARLDGTTLPAGREDGYYVDGGNVHVLTRHLSFFALMLDDEAPTPPIHLAGVVADDGLTLRWLPGTDSSGRLGNVILLVNGGEYRQFGHTQYEVKLGAIEPGDTRRFQLVQLDAAGNKSAPSVVLRAVPSVVGLGVDAARAALAERGFQLGAVHEEVVPTVAAGTVVGPAGIVMAAESTPIDLVVARGTAAPQTKFALQVASARKVTLRERTTLAARVKVTRPARLTATLYSPAKRRLVTWRRNVKAGSSIVRLGLPSRIDRPGAYRLVWVASSDGETIRRTATVGLVAPKVAARQRRDRIEVVLAGDLPALRSLRARLARTKARVVARTDDDGTFAVASSRSRGVDVAVVDVDDFGTGFVRDLHVVFPQLRLIGIARDARVRSRAVRAGAVLALPRSATAAKVAKAIARVGSGR